MTFKKFRWSQVYESPEEELVALLHTHNIDGKRTYIEAETQPVEQSAENTTTFWCAEGSMVITTSSSSISLQPGDALNLTAPTAYTIRPSMAGCVYYLTSRTL